MNNGLMGVRKFTALAISNKMYNKMQFRAQSPGQAVENLVYQWTRGKGPTAIKEVTKVWREYRKANRKNPDKLTRAMFDRNVLRQVEGEAQGFPPSSDDPFIVRGAAEVGKFWDAQAGELMRTGIAGPDGPVKIVRNYAMRQYLQEKVRLEEKEVRRVLGQHARNAIEQIKREEQDKLDKKIARYNAEISQLQMQAPEVARRTTELFESLKKLSDPRFTKVDEEIAALKAANDSWGIAEAKLKAGKDYADNLAARAEIKKEARQLKGTVGGRELQQEAIRETVADIEIANLKRLEKLHASLRVIARRAEKEGPEAWQQEFQDLHRTFMETLAKSEKAQEKILKLQETEAAAQVAKPLASALEGFKISTLESGDVVFEKGPIRAVLTNLGDEIEVGNIEGGKNAFGPREIRAFGKAIAEYFPDAQVLSGVRETGARGQAELPSDLLAAEIDLDRFRKKLPGAAEGEVAAARLARAENAELKRINKMNEAADEMEAHMEVNPEKALEMLDGLVRQRYEQTAALLEKEGQRMVSLAQRAKRADPVTAEVRIAALEQLKLDAQRAYDDKVEIGLDFQNDGETYISAWVTSAFHHMAGISDNHMDLEISPALSGPLKGRTLDMPTASIEQWLERDIGKLITRSARRVSGDMYLWDLTNRVYGKGDTTLEVVFDEIKLERETRAAEINASDKSEAAKAKALKALNDDMDQGIEDIRNQRDMLRGVFRAREAGLRPARWAGMAKSLAYMAYLGGQVLSSLTDLPRTAMVHGLMPFMRDGVLPLVTNLRGFALNVAEARAGGVATDMTSHQTASILADISDPFSMKGPVESLIANMATKFGHMTGIHLWTDFVKGLAATVMQQRLARILEFGPKNKYDEQWMAYIGLTDDTPQMLLSKVREKFMANRYKQGRLWIANTEEWKDQVAKNAYYAAMQQDVNAVITTPGIGDLPTFMREPGSILPVMFQFQSYAFASFQSVLLRGLQEKPSNFVTGMIAMTAMGMMGKYLQAAAGGEERLNDWLDKAENPGFLLAEGATGSGIAALAFTVNNVFEKGLGIGAYPFLQSFWPDESQEGQASSYTNTSFTGAIAGPSAQMADTFLRVLRDLSQGDIKERDVNGVFRLLPFMSIPPIRAPMEYGVLPGVREWAEEDNE